MHGENKMADNNSGSSGIGFTGLLQVTFIVLKLTGVITWDWVYVLLPAIISVAALIVFLILLIWAVLRDN